MNAPPRRFGHELKVDIGFASERGRRSDNQDYVAARLGGDGVGARRDVVAIVADGVGGAKAGRDAAELAVRGFFEGYFGAAPTMATHLAAGRALQAVNSWIFAQGRTDADREGMATTFTALILSRRNGALAHVGDTRLYRLSDGALELLTRDHTLGRGEMKHVLARAVGLEDSVRIDHAAFPLRLHDRFLVCSDGVHGAVSDLRLRDMLGAQNSAQRTAREIVEAALDAGSTDNATAMIVDVIDIPPADQKTIDATLSTLPIGRLPEIGECIDEFRIEAVISDGRYSRLLRATDLRSAVEVVLKFPHPRVADDATYRIAFANEAWVAGRVRSPWIGEVIDLPPGRQTRLYSVMPFYDGETLEQRLKREPEIGLREGTLLCTRMARAIATLHRAGIIHRDVKPDNVILLREGGLRLVDLGVARTPHLEEFSAQDIPGTPSYMAPELFSGHAGDEMSDLFALGVTTYRMFAGVYPYGETEPFSKPRFGRPKSLTAYRPDLPAWLDSVIARAIAVDPSERYGDVLEFSFEIENGAQQRRPAVARRRALYERNPLLVWKGVSAILLLALLVSLLTR
ncbi:MAG: bifunctional protein-serine/threonine kinase/phosphatase [Hyphomicrobiales bacterium]|nr:bifunctional protein-serine/threonine kinase/phosphatase [Hyphomicrobiales bacterium]